MLRRLTDEQGRPLQNNYRPVQELRDRMLLYRPDLTVYPWDEVRSVEAALIAKQKYLREQLAAISTGENDSDENQMD